MICTLHLILAVCGSAIIIANNIIIPEFKKSNMHFDTYNT